MNAKTITLTTLSTLVIVGATGSAVYEWQIHKPKPGITTAEAIKERNQAVDLLHLHDAVNKATVDTTTKALTDTKDKLTATCTQLKTLKQTNPNCL